MRRSPQADFWPAGSQALLGNGLSCLANMFVLSARCGVPAVYAYPKAFEGLFEKPDVWIVDPEKKLSRAALDRFLSGHRALLEMEPALAVEECDPVPYDELAEREDRGRIAFTQCRQALVDWGDGDADAQVAGFCRRGNGLVVSGCYWRQYLDMRGLAADGERLRRHLGPLRPDGRIGRRQRAEMEASCGVLRIGVHFRVHRDYAIWQGGHFHFRPEETVSVIRRLHAEVGPRRHTFYIFADVPLDPALFDGLPCHMEPADYRDDFVALASCDLVVGPPSTFASWATYLGAAKRIVLTRERIADVDASLLAMTIELAFPNGHYLPNDATGRPI